MRTWLSANLVVLVVAVGLSGCRTPGDAAAGASIPILDGESERAAGLTVEDVHNATKLYVTKCARCHKFYEPSVYHQAEWNDWMRTMSKKSRLKQDEDWLLSRYLNVIRTNSHPRASVQSISSEPQSLPSEY